MQPILAHIDPTWEQQEGRVGKVLVTRGMRLQIIQSLGVGGGNDDSNNDRDHSNSDDNSFSKGDRKTGMGGDGTEKELVATHIMGVVKVLQCYSDSSFFLSFYQLDETEKEGHHSKIIHLTIDHVLAMYSKSPAYTKALKVSRQVQMLANEKKRGVKQKHDKRYVKLEEKEKAERKLIEVAEHLTKGLMYKRTWSNGKHHQLKHKGDGDFMGVGADSNSSRYSQAERLFFSAAPPESTHSSSLHLFFLPNYVLNSVYGSNYQITPGPSSRRLSLAVGDKHENENARSTRKKRVDAKAMRAKPVLQKGCTIDGRYVIVSCFVEKGTNSYAFKAYDMKDSFEYYCAVPFSHLPFHSDSTVDGGDGGGGGNTTHANPTHHLHTNTRNSKGQTVKEFLDAHIPRLHLRAVGKRSSSLEIGHRSIASQTINDAMISHGMLELKFE